jgi:plastocyanin
MIVWLTLLMISEPPPPAQPDVSGAIYNIARDMERMQRQLAELQAMMSKLTRSGCNEKDVPPPPPPPQPEAKPPAPPPPQPEEVERGTISGRVSFEKTATKIAYVYVADVKEAPVKAVKEIRQKGKKFTPDHLVVQLGTRIEFPNEDKIYHHVFSVAPQTSFDLGYVRYGDRAPSQLFAAPGLVDINCNIHPSMNATVLVVPNRHWIQAGHDGSFTLSRVRTGKHTLHAWGPGTALAEQTVMVHADRVEPVVLKLEPKKSRPSGVYP